MFLIELKGVRCPYHLKMYIKHKMGIFYGYVHFRREYYGALMCVKISTNEPLLALEQVQEKQKTDVVAKTGLIHSSSFPISCLSAMGA